MSFFAPPLEFSEHLNHFLISTVIIFKQKQDGGGVNISLKHTNESTKERQLK